MKTGFIYLFFALLLFQTTSAAQKKTEIRLDSVSAFWGAKQDPLALSFVISIINPSLSGGNFNSKLNSHITEYVNGKVINERDNAISFVDGAGTQYKLMAVKVGYDHQKPGNTGKVVLHVDNYDHYKGGNKSASPTITFEFVYKISMANGKLMVDNMENHYQDGSKQGDKYDPAKYTPVVSELPKSEKELSKDPLPNTDGVQGGISLETNPATGKPWKYVISDGSSYVVMDISLPGVKIVNYTVEGNKGSVSSSSGGTGNSSGSINLSSGSGKLYYYPPKDIPESAGALIANTQQGKPVRYFPGKVNFNYTGADGKNQAKSIEINYCQVPVILVHGFTGDKSTWELLDRMLNQKGFMTHRGDYYSTGELSGTMDIGAQSYLLADNIQKELQFYNQNDIKCSYVDIVCHSMGGLIARHYSTIHPNIGKNVRKIIMVGTPNHGIYNAIDLMTGRAAAWFSNSHKGMALEVDASSETMNLFNSGEKNGTHINGSIQYGNIYVEGTDGVVEGRSARLNGVAEVLLTSMKHSPAIPDGMGYGTKSITTDFMVFGKIINWLNNPIPKASLNMNKWNNENTLSAGKEYDLTGKGDVLRVLNGNLTINIELRKLETDASTTAEINYADGSKVTIKPGTRINYNNDLTEILLHKGKTIYNLKKQGQTFKVITPTLQAGVKGTCFEVSVNDQGASDVYLYNGELEVENLSGIRRMVSAQMVGSPTNNMIRQNNFNPDSRYKTEWASTTGFPTLDMFSGKPGAGFSNVVIGGESMIKR